eukprot:Ihof_evm8s309 gene=Ihof_evmTU8s309
MSVSIMSGFACEHNTIFAFRRARIEVPSAIVTGMPTTSVSKKTDIFKQMYIKVAESTMKSVVFSASCKL